MTIYNWLSLFGVPAILLAIFSWTYKRLSERVKKTNTENDAIKIGVQALLRDRLYEVYKDCKHSGCANRFERENWNNLYRQYHALGANGVMDDVRQRFFDLPISDDD